MIRSQAEMEEPEWEEEPLGYAPPPPFMESGEAEEESKYGI